jgi:hypothetical protein
LLHSPFAVVFSSHIALFGEIFDHLGKRHFMYLFVDPAVFALLALWFGASRRGFFPAFDRGRIAANVTDQSVGFPPVDECFMKSLGKLGGRKVGKRTREGCLARDLSSTTPTTQPTGCRGFVKIVDQGPSVREIQDRLRDEGARQRFAIRTRTTPRSARRIMQVLFKGNELNDHRKTLEPGREGTEGLFENWKQ